MSKKIEVTMLIDTPDSYDHEDRLSKIFHDLMDTDSDISLVDYEIQTIS